MIFAPTFHVGAGFRVEAADFDGSNDYMTRGGGLTGAADSKQGIFSAWARVDGGDGAERTILSSETGSGAQINQIRLFTDNRLFIDCGAAGDPFTISLRIRTAGTILAGASWRHILASWDVAAAERHLYIDDVSDVVQVLYNNLNVDYTNADWAIGATTGAFNKFNGGLAELYYAPGQYLDFSVEANRRKFISAASKPVNLGGDGSLPTGSAPLVYQRLGAGEAVANFATNRGTGGDFSITGTLDLADTSPAS